MTISEFQAKPLVSDNDAADVVESNTFDDVKAYIATGTDSRVAAIFHGVWHLRGELSAQQMLDAILAALFGNQNAEIRWKTATTALMLANTLNIEDKLQEAVAKHWGALDEAHIISFAAGLHGFDGVTSWIPTLRQLFSLNNDSGVRTHLVRAVANVVKASGSLEFRNLLVAFLKQMPELPIMYARSQNFETVRRIRSEL